MTHALRVRAAARIALAGSLAALLVAASPALAKPERAHVASVQMGRAQRVRAATLADVNGDGARDLVIAGSIGGRRKSRFLHVHLRGKSDPVFRPDPDRELELPEDVVALAVADVDDAPGAEVLLLTGVAAYAWVPTAEPEKRFRRLFDLRLLWQLPHPRNTFFWQAGVQDLDGDGLDDLAFPEPGGFAVALQRREGGERFFAETRHLRVPMGGEAEIDGRPRGAAKMERRRRSRELLRVGAETGQGDENSGPLLTVAEHAPAPLWLDWDADGDLDLLAQSPGHLNVWLQGAGGTFDTAPSLRQPLPVVLDRSRRLDVSYSALAGDLDRDGRADCVIVAGDQRSDDVRTQILVFRQGAGRGRSQQTAEAPLFGPRGLPTQLLVLAGFVGAPHLVDVDGDGAQDLTVASLRLDALDTIRAAASGSIDIDLHVYRAERGVLPRTPSLTIPLEVEGEGLRRSKQRTTIRLLGDINGDRVSELLVRPEPEVLRVMRLRRSRDGLAVADTNHFSLKVDDDAEFQIDVPRGGGRAELLVLEDLQVLHVRFP